MALGALAAIAGSALVSDDAKEPARAERPAAPAEDAPRGYDRFRDRAARFSIAHPSDWIRLPARGNTRLLAAKAGASFSLSVSSIGIEVGAQSLGPARTITDELVSQNPSVRLLRRPQTTVLAELPGYLYLYTFRDSESKRRAFHAHYFLFRGKQLYSLVFQAIPASSFRALTKTFDSIAQTLRVTPPREGVGGTA